MSIPKRILQDLLFFDSFQTKIAFCLAHGIMNGFIYRRGAPERFHSEKLNIWANNIIT